MLRILPFRQGGLSHALPPTPFGLIRTPSNLCMAQMIFRLAHKAPHQGFLEGLRNVILARNLQAPGGEGCGLLIAGVNIHRKSIYLDTALLTLQAFSLLIYSSPLCECMFVICTTSPLMMPCQIQISSHYF